MYVNNVVVVGNLTSDPRQGGAETTKVVNFRMAVNRWRKPAPEGQEQTEEFKERTDFVDVECWGSQAENVLSSLARGARAIVAGQLRFEEWIDGEGNTRNKMRIRATAVGASLEFQPVTV